MEHPDGTLTETGTLPSKTDKFMQSEFLHVTGLFIVQQFQDLGSIVVSYANSESSGVKYQAEEDSTVANYHSYPFVHGEGALAYTNVRET